MQRVFDFLKKQDAHHVAIFSHVRGDGDCLGAQTGLAEVLRNAGFEVALYNQEALTEQFRFLTHFDEIVPFTDASPLPDVCIAVDCATLARIGTLPEKVLAQPWINIDHHISNDGFGALTIVDGGASSTCEVLSRMALDDGVSLSKAAATSFYTGMSTDTGSFRYPSANAQTFYTAAKLLDAGADKNLVQEYFFENTSRKRITIYQYLYSHLVFLRDGALAYCVFSRETLDALGVAPLDLEGVVSLIREIQGVEVAVLFSESEKNHCKISLRSRSWFDCNRCCALFGGGGHVRASGANFQAPLDHVVETVLQTIDTEWKEMPHVK